jgi:hypothetical protein
VSKTSEQRSTRNEVEVQSLQGPFEVLAGWQEGWGQLRRSWLVMSKSVAGRRVVWGEKIADTLHFFSLTTSPPMSPKTSSEPFKRRKELSKQHSDNPKTVRNRMNEAGKAGLDAAFLRADTAFRTAKCRNLAKLHNGPNWSAMSPRQKAAAEATIVKKLEAKRDKRKREHELE